MLKKAVMLLVGITMTISTSNVFAANPDDVLGLWLTSQKADATKVEIVKCGDKYCGKVAWLKDPEMLDTQNPDESKRSQKLLGLDMIYGFEFDDDEWVDGYIYNPEDGKTYDCRMWLESGKVLNVKGTVGPKWMGIGKTVVWYKAE